MNINKVKEEKIGERMNSDESEKRDTFKGNYEEE